MKIVHSNVGSHSCYRSPFYTFSLATDKPSLSYLGVESGGRTDRHTHYNLLRPGLGGPILPWKSGGRNQLTTVAASRRTEYRFRQHPTLRKIAFQFVDERRIKAVFEFVRPFQGDFFEFNFANDVAPVTIWAKEGPAQPRNKSTEPTNSYAGPLLLHFPDYGLWKIACSDRSVIGFESFCRLKEMEGLSLGYKQVESYHRNMIAHHYGHTSLKLRALQPVKRLVLTLTVEPEVYPQIKGCDFRAPRWAGLKRCWLNSFTLEKKSLTMGDNVSLPGMAHLAMHFKGDLLRFTPALPNGIRIQDYLRKAVVMSFDQCMAASGEMSWEYYRNPNLRQVMAPFIDSTPSVLWAYGQLFEWDQNKAFARRYVEKARKASRYLMGFDQDQDGIIEVPYHGNYFGEERKRCRNWWDNFAFGHKDIYFNVLCYEALRSVRTTLEKLKVEDGKQELDLFLSRFAKNFDRIFFNPRTGVYAGWISQDGKVHDYYFTFATAMAINAGLVPRKKGLRALGILLRKMEEEGFDFKYGVPGPAQPVPRRDTIKGDFTGGWNRYENGGLCGQTAYHFIQALYRCGLRKKADEILFKMLETFEKEPTHSGLMPGYMKSIDWRTKEGNPCGYNYLADNYYFLLAAVTGHYQKTMVS